MVNGDQYVGNWYRGKRHGQGIYYFANGSIYQGEWVDGALSGQGSIHIPIKKWSYAGMWVDWKR